MVIVLNGLAVKFAMRQIRAIVSTVTLISQSLSIYLIG
ncbi:hypothetical protein BTN49_0409 [Candidatus Enterovibrio escicola]|uniref:Uncharacterized protein n=1 Tax=Candidatus Enterovibrio escicola TaxID=1927127 RepID=A0A2A5T5N1_9GAMM|nr:hypothetical protein BTN49_0409 [Candidatus Enterovibrio escacola]